MGTEKQGPLGPKQSWSARRKRDTVLRLLQGEPLDPVSRDLGIEIYRLERWREQALSTVTFIFGQFLSQGDSPHPMKGRASCK